MATMRQWGPIMEEVRVDQTKMSTSSTMFSMLPASLQASFPLRSVRKSVSMQTLKARQSTSAPRTPTHGPTRSLSGIDAIPFTGSATASESGLMPDDDSSSDGMGRRQYSPPPDYPPTPLIEEPVNSHHHMTPHHQSMGAPSGVKWRFTHQGLSLMTMALDEARQPKANPGEHKFERKVFLDGVEYILQSLPDDLNEQEVDRLRGSLPPTLLPPAGAAASAHHSTPGDASGRHANAYARPVHDKSVLHRTVQSVVVQLFLLFQLALPYVVLLAQLAVRAEREYKVSENVFSGGLALANSIGSKSRHLTLALCNMSDGRVGQALGDAVSWTVDGFAGGLTEGVGEGLLMVRAKGR